MDNQKWLWIVLGLAGAGICSLACIAVAAIGIVMFGVAVPFTGMPKHASITPSPGSTAPDFELTTLDGDTVSLGQFRGSPVLLDFSATWCSDCQDTAPRIQELRETYTDLVILSVYSGENVSTVQEFTDEYGLTCPIALDHKGRISDLYHILAIPTLFFIDSNGVIQDVIIEDYSDARMAEALDKIGIKQ
ncbi:MAG: redoxin domain-containing protein [Anaerolineae bacterium]|nr:redoxin domain-containing protein [Anaerolineae bacterium]